MLRLVLLFLFACLAACGRGAAEDAKVASVTVEGEQRFVTQVTRALHVLQNEAPDAFQLVNTYVGVIRQGARSGMWAYRDPPTLELSDRTAHYSVTWCAGTLVHDAHHSMLYHDYRSKNSVPVPHDVWIGVAAERAAIERQLSVMVAVGAPKHETNYLSILDGTHHDITGEGEYSWADYDPRDW